MKLLAIDTSSQSASCAVTEDGVLLGEFYTNVKLTHSQTILPMVDSLLESVRLSLRDMDCIGVTTGPGSFTGLRIGLSAVKGMAHGLGLPCVGISTLEALAESFHGIPCLVAPVLDARCAQVYTALFRVENEAPIRLMPDEAISLEELESRLGNAKSPVFLVGDGANLCYNELKNRISCALPSPALLYTRASGLALACERAWKKGLAVSAEELMPEYLRLPQAQRELLAKQKTAQEA